jgi:hypothetical protein
VAANTPAAAPRLSRNRPTGIASVIGKGGDRHARGQDNGARVQRFARCPAERAVRPCWLLIPVEWRRDGDGFLDIGVKRRIRLPGLTLDVARRLVGEAHGRICHSSNAGRASVPMALALKSAGNSHKARGKTMDQLKRKRVLITGASSGIGEATERRRSSRRCSTSFLLNGSTARASSTTRPRARSKQPSGCRRAMAKSPCWTNCSQRCRSAPTASCMWGTGARMCTSCCTSTAATA